MSKDVVNVKLDISKEIAGRDILLKMQTPQPKPDKVQKFRSFQIASLGTIMLGNKAVTWTDLYDLLKKHGLSKTLPSYVTLNPAVFVGFDWSPPSYAGPTVWYFTWNNQTECSITANNQTGIAIRVHDMTPGVGERILDEIATELLKYVKQTSGELQVFTAVLNHNTYQWHPLCTRKHRDLNTIYINEAVKDKLVKGITKFYEAADLYDKYGVTWKKNFLFAGPPGVGKTSMVIALASIFKKNVAKLTVTKYLQSDNLEYLFHNIKPDTFLVMEDVDALFVDREAKTGVDFSTLLNCMDGITSKRGLVTFMTTNHIEKIDKAFVRVGRIDEKYEFTYPSEQELRAALANLGANWQHEHNEFIKVHGKGMTIAKLQQHLFICLMEERTTIMNME